MSKENKPKSAVERARERAKQRKTGKTTAPLGSSVWENPKALILRSARIALYLIVFFHLIAMTPFTYSLDEIKKLSLWIGGGLCFTLGFVLIYFKAVHLPSRSVMIGMALFLVSFVLSTLMMEKQFQWAGWIETRNWWSAAGFVFLAMLTHTDRRGIRDCARFWCFSGLLLCGIGLFHYFGFVENITPPQTNSDQPNRWNDLIRTLAQTREMFSTILNTQFFANILLIFIPLFLAGFRIGLPILGAPVDKKAEFLKQEQNESNKPDMLLGISGGLAFILGILCIGLTYSKSSLFTLPLAVGVTLLGWPLLAKVRGFRLPYWPVFISLITVNFLSILWFFRQDLMNRFSTFDDSTQSRSIIFGGAIELWKTSPLFGVGPGAFILKFPEVRSADYHMNAISNVTLSAHNWLLDTLSQIGLVGALCLFFWMGAVLFQCWKHLRSEIDDNSRMVTWTLIVGIGAGLIASLATPVLVWPIGQVVYALAIGMLIGITNPFERVTEENQEIINSESPNAAIKRQPIPVNFFAGIGIAGAVLSVVFIYSNFNHGVAHFKGAIAHNNGLRNTMLPQEILANREIQYLNFKEQQFNKAKDFFENALSNNQYFLTSYYRKAHAMNLLSNNQQVKVEEMIKANQENINNPEVRSRLIQEFESFVTKQMDVYETYDNLAEYAPDYSEIHYNRAVLKLSLANQKANFYSKVADREYLNSTIVPEVRSDFEEAVKHANKAAEMSNKVTAWFMKSMCTERLADVITDNNELKKDTYKQAGLSYLNTATLPLTRATQKENQNIQEETQRVQSAQKVGTLLIKAEAWEALGDAAETLIKDFPSLKSLILQGCEGYIRAGQPDKAENFMKRRFDNNPADPDLYIMRLRLSVSNPTYSPPLSVEEQIALIERLESELPVFLNENLKREFEELKNTYEAQKNSATDNEESEANE